jgi:hypothetical protein
MPFVKRQMLIRKFYDSYKLLTGKQLGLKKNFHTPLAIGGISTLSKTDKLDCSQRGFFD